MTTERKVVVGVFADRAHAQQAVDDLMRAGFSEAQIGMAGRNDETISRADDVSGEASKAEEGALAGALTGAGLGGLWGIGVIAGLLPAIGPVIAGGTLAAVLASAATGAAVASLVGALIGMGIPEEEAQYYETEFRSGRTLVTVKADDRYDEAWAILRRHGAYDMRTAGTTPRREEVVIERHPVSGQPGASWDIKKEEVRVAREGDVKVHGEDTPRPGPWRP